MDDADTAYRLDPSSLAAGLPDVLAEAANNAAAWPVRRAGLLRLLSTEVYGFSPPPPSGMLATVVSTEEHAYGDKATQTTYDLSFDTPAGRFSFPFQLLVPRIDRPPLILHIAFRSEIPDRYCPAEEILDEGFAYASFCYNDVAPDEDDGFSGGLAGAFAHGGRGPDSWGKIALWAWAASRVMDILQTLPGLDPSRMAVVGHSRLGKAALWCGAQDERFTLVVSNESGCGGTALHRGKHGERIRNITDRFGYWFCDNFRQYAGRDDEMPFDQHFLLACIAPRMLYHGSAVLDTWSDPFAEFQGCLATDPAYRLLGVSGIAGPVVEYPDGPVRLSCHEGRIGYHLREGSHFFSRTDWGQIMSFWKKQGRENRGNT